MPMSDPPAAATIPGASAAARIGHGARRAARSFPSEDHHRSSRPPTVRTPSPRVEGYDRRTVAQPVAEPARPRVPAGDAAVRGACEDIAASRGEHSCCHRPSCRKNTPKARGQQRAPQDGLGVGRRLQLGGADGHPERLLWIHVELGQCAGGERARLGRPRGAASIAALDERENRDPSDDRKRERRQRRENERTPVAPLCLAQLPLRLPACAPREDGVSKDVVEDLVPPAGPIAGRQRPQDALAGQTIDDAAQRSLVCARIAREVVDSVRDLRSRRSNQVVEERRSRFLLLVVESRQRTLEVLLDDPLGPAELRERRAPERR